uniref:Reverse transcriptase domain-containing protein n=1 Tax=Oryzias latipes TaxID=8090 RepID=A0A3P9LB20_ORYLA
MLNNSLLKLDIVQQKVSEFISYFYNLAKEENCYSKNWELFKCEITNFLRNLSSELNKTKKAKESQIINDIMTISKRNPAELSDDDKINLALLQKELDSIYKNRAEGAFVRSRLKWLEEGENNSSYFFQLEKRRAKTNTLEQLNIEDQITSDPKIIANYVNLFYSKLYAFEPSEDPDHFLHYNLQQIQASERDLCDSPLSENEVLFSINHLKNNKSPGPDGLTGEFYKQFSDKMTPFLTQVFVESIEKGFLPPTLNQGVLTLIPKPKKDVLLIDNWRPICLLNNDYKILASVFAKRLKSVLNSVIAETQSGFMQNRLISNNIRLVLDILDYSHLISDDSFILFLDFYKASDSVNHHFIFSCLHKFGFGPFFCNTVKTLYNNANCSVKLKYGTSPRFNLNRGIRQGCPISPYLFLLVTQTLADYITIHKLKGISVLYKEILISQLADDTTLFLRDSSQVSCALNLIQSFSDVSGLRLNLNKCELLPVKDCALESICNIPVKENVTYLGIIISKNNSERCSLNFTPLIDKAKKRFNQWLQRDLSLRGRILLSKAEGISRLTYSALYLHLDNQTLKSIDQMLLNFIWKNRIHYFKKSVLMNSYEKGGLNFLDFTTLNNTFKINWIKSYLKNPLSIWNIFPHHMFAKVGGLRFLLLCHYNIDRQTLLSWALIYKHNFSPHKFFIWNNRYILYKNKSLFYNNWFDNNILLVGQLFNHNGQLLGYEEFNLKYNLAVPPKEYAIVFDAVTNEICELFKNTALDANIPFISLSDTTIGKSCLSCARKNNKIIRALFQQNVISVPSAVFYWRKFIPDLPWKNVWTLHQKLLINNKMRDVSYKLLHRIYPTNQYMIRYKKTIDPNCAFCKEHPETISHLFWNCNITKKLWKDCARFINYKLDSQYQMKFEHIIFGLHERNIRSNVKLAINLTIIFGKFHIHKSKFSSSQLFFPLIIKELESYLHTISNSLNKKAIHIYENCLSLNIFNA